MKKDLNDFYQELKEDGILVNSLAWSITITVYLLVLSLGEVILSKNLYIERNVITTMLLILIISLSGMIIATEELEIFKSVVEENESNIKKIRLRYIIFKGFLGFSFPISLFMISIIFLSGKATVTSIVMSFIIYNIIGIAIGISSWMKIKFVFINYIKDKFYKKFKKGK
ncbi:MAG: hypothetical protein AB6733_22850 [Clostridiaceae bacterium]